MATLLFCRGTQTRRRQRNPEKRKIARRGRNLEKNHHLCGQAIRSSLKTKPVGRPPQQATDMNQKIKNAALVFAISFIIARLMMWVFEFVTMSLFSSGSFNLENYRYHTLIIELCWAGIMLVSLIGGIFYAIYFTKGYCAGGDNEMEGAKTVRAGISVFLIGIFLSLLPEASSENKVFFQAFRIVTHSIGLLNVVGLALMTFGFGKMKKHSITLHGVKSGFGILQDSSVLLLIAMGYSFAALLCSSLGFNLITTASGNAILKTSMQWLINPLKIAGMAVLIHGWVKIAHNSNIS